MNPFEKLSIRKMPMVKWFDPAQLINTGIKVVVSTFIGEQSDRRIIQALSAIKEDYFDLSRHYKESGGIPVPEGSSEREEIWIDYISDTGDGWNSTYGIAHIACSDELRLHSGSAKSKHSYITRRGNALIFGGDEVYPTPSKENYHRRLVVPFATAFGDSDPDEYPHVFAIPGNHDWYDGLAAFTKLFCSDLNPRFAAWHSRQRRSYFAVKLPGNWWILGSDGQLQSDIDTPQLEYFRMVCNNHMAEGDKVIMCISQPDWIYAHKYRKYGEPYDESDMVYLQQEIFAQKNIAIKVYLSGDYHHYRRHEEMRTDGRTPVQKITAGGGGAFLHPTHDIDVSVISENYGFKKKSGRKFTLKKSYPEVNVSRKLTFRNLLFPLINPGFGIMTAAIYLFTAWLVSSSVEFRIPESFTDSYIMTAEAFFRNPLAGVWLILLIGGFIFFTDTHSTLYKWAGGFLHALAHLNAIFYLSVIAFAAGLKFFPDQGYFMYLFIMATVFTGGWIAGSFVFGLYLFISQYFFGRHNEESFSAARIQDYKNFLRLHIAKDGRLTIYPIKLERAPRRWRERSEEEAGTVNSLIVPVDGSKAELIEDPIVLKY